MSEGFDDMMRKFIIDDAETLCQLAPALADLHADLVGQHARIAAMQAEVAALGAEDALAKRASRPVARPVSKVADAIGVPERPKLVWDWRLGRYR